MRWRKNPSSLSEKMSSPLKNNNEGPFSAFTLTFTMILMLVGTDNVIQKRKTSCLHQRW